MDLVVVCAMTEREVNWASTREFVNAFGNEEAERQRRKFERPGWAKGDSANDDDNAAQRNPLLKVGETCDECVHDASMGFAVIAVWLLSLGVVAYVVWRYATPPSPAP